MHLYAIIILLVKYAYFNLYTYIQMLQWQDLRNWIRKGFVLRWSLIKRQVKWQTMQRGDTVGYFAFWNACVYKRKEFVFLFRTEDCVASSSLKKSFKNLSIKADSEVIECGKFKYWLVIVSPTYFFAFYCPIAGSQ